MATEADRFKELYDVERHVMTTDGGILVEDPYPAVRRAAGRGTGARGHGAGAAGTAARAGFGPRRTRPLRRVLVRGERHRPPRERDVLVEVLRRVTSPRCSAAACSRWSATSTVATARSCSRRSHPSVHSGGSTNWIEAIVDEAVSAFENRGHAELNAELCSRIPLQTITVSFGLTREQALDFRESTEAEPEIRRRSAAQRRVRAPTPCSVGDRGPPGHPQDDVITHARRERDRRRRRAAICSPTTRSSGSPASSSPPVRARRGVSSASCSSRCCRTRRRSTRSATIGSCCGGRSTRWCAGSRPIRSSVGWSRGMSKLCGVDIPAGAVVDMNLGAANRDPTRWDDPDPFDLYRDPEAEPRVRRRTPRLLGHARRTGRDGGRDERGARSAPRPPFRPEAPPARIIGLEHRGPNGVPVVFGKAA